MPISLTTPPTVEPVTLVEAKAHLRVDSSDEDSLITAWITAARQYIEDRTWRQLCTATYTLKLDTFPNYGSCAKSGWMFDGIIYVPRPPLQSVTSIAYTDTNNVTQTWSASNYLVDAVSEPGRISAAYNTYWPFIRGNAFANGSIVFVAGYGLAVSVPTPLKQALLLLVSHFNENREATSATDLKTVPFAIDCLLAGYEMRDKRVLEFI